MTNEQSRTNWWCFCQDGMGLQVALFSSLKFPLCPLTGSSYQLWRHKFQPLEGKPLRNKLKGGKCCTALVCKWPCRKIKKTNAEDGCNRSGIIECDFILLFMEWTWSDLLMMLFCLLSPVRLGTAPPPPKKTQNPAPLCCICWANRLSILCAFQETS